TPSLSSLASADATFQIVLTDVNDNRAPRSDSIDYTRVIMYNVPTGHRGHPGCSPTTPTLATMPWPTTRHWWSLIVEAFNPVALTTPGVAWPRVCCPRVPDQQPGPAAACSCPNAARLHQLGIMEKRQHPAPSSAVSAKFSWSFVFGLSGHHQSSSGQNFRFADYNGIFVGTDSGYEHDVTRPTFLLHLRCASNNTPSTRQLVSRVAALDYDTIVGHRTITYSLAPVSDSDKIEIDANTGELFTHRSGLVFDRRPRSLPYAVTVEATDRAPSVLAGHPAETPNKATLNISISLSDINDNPPMFNASSFTVSGIPEDTPLGRVITQPGRWTTTRCPNSYSLAYVAFDGIFPHARPPSRFSLSIVVDFRPIFGGSHLLTIANHVSENASPGQMHKLAIIVEVLRLIANDKVPIFLTSSCEPQRDENTPLADVFATVRAYDPDLNSLTYSLLPAAAGSQEAPEYRQSDVERRTETEDGVGRPCRNLTGTVTVHIQDASDTSPSFVSGQPATLSVSEAVGVNDTAVVALAQDADVADSGRLQVLAVRSAVPLISAWPNVRRH
uniref:CA domain-containing protein n=1 Tax=Macrostomum lignano TaxID=282301 RepID=A0A1I8FIB6_9PLAT